MVDVLLIVAVLIVVVLAIAESRLCWPTRDDDDPIVPDRWEGSE